MKSSAEGDRRRVPARAETHRELWRRDNVSSVREGVIELKRTQEGAREKIARPAITRQLESNDSGRVPRT